MYLLHIFRSDRFELAERRFMMLRGPAALLKFSDGSGGWRC